MPGFEASLGCHMKHGHSWQLHSMSSCRRHGILIGSNKNNYHHDHGHGHDHDHYHYYHYDYHYDDGDYCYYGYYS